MSEDYGVELPGTLAPDSWIQVSGGSLDHPVDVKIRLDGRGRPVVVGLRLDSGSEVTARALRKIKLPEIAAAVIREVTEVRDHSWGPVTEYVRKALAASSYKPGELATAADHGYPGAAELDAAVWEAANAHQLDEYLSRIADAGDADLLVNRGRGSRAPSTDEYQAFARAWLETLKARGKYRLADRVADQVGMSRPTVYRWASECRRLGLIPHENGESGDGVDSEEA